MKKKKKTTSSKSFSEKLLSNKTFLRILSLILGIICWLLVVTVVDDDTTVTVTDIPVEINLEDTIAQKYGLSLIEGSGQTVSIRVQGRRVEIGSLTAEDFTAHAVLSEVNSMGEYILNVEVTKKNSSANYDIIRTSPSTINASFDYLDEQTFEIVGEAVGMIPGDGYIKEGEIIVTPDALEVVGPRNEISKIDRCVAVSDETATLTETTTVPAELVFYDAAGNELDLPHVEYRAQNFEITVPIYKQKTVPIVPNFVNVPTGVDVSKLKYTMSETSISIAGQEKLVDSIESISLSEIDFRKVDVGSSFVQQINLSAGLINLDSLNTVTILFDDDEMASTTLNINNILISNPSSLYDVSLITTKLSNVKIVGDKDVINSLSASDFVANVNLADTALSQGTLRVYVDIHALNSAQVWAVGEYAVTLNVTAKS